jgi:hypothetical protein
MSSASRRDFQRASASAALSAAIPSDLVAQSATAKSASEATWNSGSVRHLLLAVSDNRMLITWVVKTQTVDAIDRLQPFHRPELTRPT